MSEIEYLPGTALVVVDVQNDFADPDGSLYVQGGEDVVPLINREIERAQAANVPVVYTKDWHPSDTPHFAKYGGNWPVHCVHDTWGAEFHPDLKVVGEIVHKATGPEDGYSGFSMTHLRPVSGARRGSSSCCVTAASAASSSPGSPPTTASRRPASTRWRWGSTPR